MKWMGLFCDTPTDCRTTEQRGITECRIIERRMTEGRIPEYRMLPVVENMM
jgi:hypothetical protein